MKYKILVIFLVLYEGGCKFRRKINDPAYTIGKVTRKTSNRGGFWADYSFNYKNISYDGLEALFSYERNNVVVDKKYYIKFSKSNPNKSELLFNWIIPDSIL